MIRTDRALVLRVSFGLAVLLLGWSLMAWWGAATSPVDRFKFGALGAARIVNFATDHPTQERCYWHVAGQFEQYCRPAQDGAWRLLMLELGASALVLALILALVGMLTLRPTAAVLMFVATVFAVLNIVGNAPTALAFAPGRAVSTSGSGTTAAVCACDLALTLIGLGSRRAPNVATRSAA